MIALSILILFYFGAVIGIRIVTQHGETVQVPDLSGYNETQLARVIDTSEFRYEVIDSVYTQEIPPGTVYDQIPKPGAFVKKNRKIFLIQNAKKAELITVPSVVNMSLRQAKSILQSSGLLVGEIIYMPSEFTNLVLNQVIGEEEVEAGVRLPKWTSIDLHVGKGLGTERVDVPYLRGMYWIDAKAIISALNLSEGSVIEDATIDTEIGNDSALVWKQYPQPMVVTQYGKGVDVWLTMDTVVVYAADTTLRMNNIAIDE